MICELEGVNNRDDVEDLVVFSTDIEVMYPSLDTDQVAADLAREFLDCELGVNFDETELALYLALEMETDMMLSLVLEHAIKIAMQNHIYSYKGETGCV